jgi:hypothetical protein
VGKLWWQDPKPAVKPWKIDKKRDPCACSLRSPLRVSGYSETQGPTHYCPFCRWGFWKVIMKPTSAQVDYERITNYSASLESMTYEKFRNKPEAPKGKDPKDVMIDQLGGLLPYYLTAELKEYWDAKYCEKYPNSVRAIARKKREEEKKKDNQQPT